MKTGRSELTAWSDVFGFRRKPRIRDPNALFLGGFSARSSQGMIHDVTPRDA